MVTMETIEPGGLIILTLIIFAGIAIVIDMVTGGKL